MTKVYCAANGCTMDQEVCEHRHMCDCHKRLPPGTYAAEFTILEVDDEGVTWMYFRTAGKVFRTPLSDMELVDE